MKLIKCPMIKWLSIFMGLTALATFAEPTVTDVVAKQRYPWNGLVDITCKVSGISGTTNLLDFAVAAVMPDSGEVRGALHFWVVQNGVKLADCEVHTNGDYKLLWDAQADLGQVRCDNMVVRVTTVKGHAKVQLWEGGPYWATTNIGAEKPENYGYYFWWGDTVGYKRVNNKWVATDGSSSDFSFGINTVPTYDKSTAVLLSKGWITADNVLAPEHDAAHVLWGGRWRMPTEQEMSDLKSKCDWTWTTKAGITGYVVRGRGVCAAQSVFIPSAGFGDGTSLSDAGEHGYIWLSESCSDSHYTALFNQGSKFYYSWYLSFDASYVNVFSCFRLNGLTIRPIQGGFE